MKKKFHIRMPHWKRLFMGRSFFFMLAILFLTLTIVFVIQHARFIFRELGKGFSRGDGTEEIPRFDIEGFRKLNLIRQQ
ncbi:MAG: hypothetical protein Q8R20_02330 [Nanoarchaeota archaeon]|nr:hypothetical protein [Nanoarchaeota archaeon]